MKATLAQHWHRQRVFVLPVVVWVSAQSAECKGRSFKKALLSRDVPTKVPVKWGLCHILWITIQDGKISHINITHGLVSSMWWNLGKSVWSRACDNLSFICDWSAHLERNILLKIPSKSDQWFQSYEQLKDSQNIENKRNLFLFLAISHNQCFRLHTDMANRRPAKGQKSLQKIVLMAFFSTSKQLCQIFSTKITNDDVGCWPI